MKKNHLKRIVNMKLKMEVCDKKATIKCLYCIKTISLFCEECFKKAHKRRAYQNHQKIFLIKVNLK
jgi:hypothetical protein